MSPEKIVFIIGLLFISSIVALFLYKKLPKRLKKQNYVKKWRELQILCKDKSEWRHAVISADKLLDKAMKQRKIKGKSPGERLVSAQRRFNSNDDVWAAHNLYKKLMNNPDLQPKEVEIKKALTSFRQALRDLGALPSEKKINE